MKWIGLALVGALLIYGCSPGSTYERRLKKELASGERYDSLFMGIYFGMAEKDFYTHCWDLNRLGEIKQGSQNLSVEHELKKELNYPATMNFYPEFAQGKIVEMPVKFIYNGWTPWNKSFLADSLQLDVLSWYEQIYGQGFMNVEHPDRGTAYVLLSGNRRITIYKEDEMHVWAIFTDMLAKSELSDSTSVVGNMN